MLIKELLYNGKQQKESLGITCISQKEALVLNRFLKSKHNSEY